MKRLLQDFVSNEHGHSQMLMKCGLLMKQQFW